LMDKFNRFIEKWMPLVTPVSLLIGVLFADQLGRALFLVPYVFAFMTFSGSLKSQFRDFANVFQHPLPLLSTLSVIHIVMPLIARTVGSLLFPQNPYIITGMVLEFIVPSAVVSFMWVSIYHGNSALTLSVVLTDTLLAPFLVPLSLHLLVGSSVQMDTGSLMRELIFMIALPALLALTLNQATGGRLIKPLSHKLAPYGKIALIFVVSVNSTKVAPYIRHMTPMLFTVTGVMLLIAASGYAVGWLAALLLRQKREVIVSMTFNSGMRNISAGAVIAAAYFPPEVMFPVMIGTLFQQILAATYAHLLVRCYGNENPEEITSKNGSQNLPGPKIE
jgi:BASS family bile acid:Na+ symporter